MMFPVPFLFYTKGGKALNDKARKARNDYMKKWRSENKEKVKAAQQRYWEKKVKKIKEVS